MILSQESQQSLAITSSLPWLSRLHVLCCRRKKNAHVRHLAAQVLMASRHREQYIAIQHVFPWLLLAMLWKMFRRLEDFWTMFCAKSAKFSRFCIIQWLSGHDGWTMVNMHTCWILLIDDSVQVAVDPRKDRMRKCQVQRRRDMKSKDQRWSKIVSICFNMFQYMTDRYRG